MESSASSRLLARAGDDDNVVGVVPHGSRARGVHVREDSDWDLIVVVRELSDAYKLERGAAVETAVMRLTTLAEPPDWIRPALLWAEPLLDKTGEVAAALKKATTVDRATAGEPLGGYTTRITDRRRTRALGSSSRPCSTRRSRSRGTCNSSSTSTGGFARTTRLDAVVDGWEPDLDWLRGE